MASGEKKARDFSYLFSQPPAARPVAASPDTAEEVDMAAVMGFSGFGGKTVVKGKQAPAKPVYLSDLVDDDNDDSGSKPKAAAAAAATASVQRGPRQRFVLVSLL